MPVARSPHSAADLDTLSYEQVTASPHLDKWIEAATKEIQDLIKDSTAKVEEGVRLVNESGEVLSEITTSVADASETVTDAKLDRVSMVGGGSVYPAVQNAMLACVEEGLGCTLTTLHCMREDDVMQALDIPEGWATVAMVPIGYPVGRGHGPITRQPPASLAYRDRFGSPWS